MVRTGPVGRLIAGPLQRLSEDTFNDGLLEFRFAASASGASDTLILNAGRTVKDLIFVRDRE